MTEKENLMYESQEKEVSVLCNDGSIVTGYCEEYVSAIDNTPEIAEIVLKTTSGITVGLTAAEIEKISYIN